jgi:AbrB family looped-hinge helix DNA binding protein
MRITSKGQVTIPREIRERAGLVPGTEVEFTLDATGVRIRKIERMRRNAGRGERAIARLRRTGTVRMSTDRIMSQTRG